MRTIKINNEKLVVLNRIE